MTKNRAAKQATRAAMKQYGGRYTDHINIDDIFGRNDISLPEHLKGREAAQDFQRFINDWGLEKLNATFIAYLFTRQEIVGYDKLKRWIATPVVRDELYKKSWGDDVTEVDVAKHVIKLIAPLEELRQAAIEYQNRNIEMRIFHGISGDYIAYDDAHFSGFCKNITGEHEKANMEVATPELLGFLRYALEHPTTQDHYVMAILGYAVRLYLSKNDLTYAKQVLDAVPIREVKYQMSSDRRDYLFHHWGENFHADVKQMDHTINGDRERKEPLGYVKRVAS